MSFGACGEPGCMKLADHKVTHPGSVCLIAPRGMTKLISLEEAKARGLVIEGGPHVNVPVMNALEGIKVVPIEPTGRVAVDRRESLDSQGHPFPAVGTIPCRECHRPLRLPDMKKRKTDGVLLCVPCWKREEK